MVKPLSIRLHEILINEEKTILKIKKKPSVTERRSIAHEIVNGRINHLQNKDLTIGLLEQFYGKKLNTNGPTLYPLFVDIILDEWEKMGEENRKHFSKDGAQIIDTIRGQFNNPESKG